MLNAVSLIGNLGADPEMKYTTNGTALATFRLAVNDYAKDSEGKAIQKTSWIPCIAWGKNAEVMGQYTAKGAKIGIVGKLTEHTWEDQQGNKRSRLEVRIDQVELLGSREQNGQAKAPPPSQQQQRNSYQPPPPPAAAPGTYDDDIPF